MARHNNDCNQSATLLYVFSGFEAVLCLISLIQVYRIFRATSLGGPRFQAKKLFHILVFSVTFLRAIGYILFGYYMGVKGEVIIKTAIIWNHACEMILVMSYLVLLGFWADFYSRLVFWQIDIFDHYRNLIFIFFFFFTFLNLSFFLLLIQVGASENNSDLWIDDLWALYACVLFAWIACGFFVYGIRLFRALSDMGKESVSKSKEILIVGILCTVCFGVRAIWIIEIVAKDPPWKGEESSCISLNAASATTYFVITEMIPILLMLIFLREVNPRRISTYQNENQLGGTTTQPILGNINEGERSSSRRTTFMENLSISRKSLVSLSTKSRISLNTSLGEREMTSGGEGVELESEEDTFYV